MAAYVLHVVDREKGLLMVNESPNGHSFDFLFEVLTGPFASERGSHRELSDLVREPIIVMSGTVGICHRTGAILDWQQTDSQHGTWMQRHSETKERALGASYTY
jgi:hypothetical protein